MGTIVWRKPSGLEFETNDSQATIDYCLKMGMKNENFDLPEPKKPEPPKPVKKGKGK